MDQIDPRFAGFIRGSISSLWTLELLLLLHRQPERRWSIEQANRELRATPTLVADRLRQLAQNGLACCDGHDSWRFAPRSERLAAMADLAARFSRERPFWIVNLLLAKEDNWRPL